MERVGVITDPHGCKKTYVALRNKVKRKFPDIQFCLSGDINDRGKSTRQLVNYVLKVGDDWIKGNHEDLMANWFFVENNWIEPFDVTYDLWLYNGGYDALESYGYDCYKRKFTYKKEFIEHQNIMRNLPIYKIYDIEDEEGRKLLVSHSSAAKVWGWPESHKKMMQKQFDKHLMWERNANPRPIPGYYNVFGHTPHWNRVTDHFANIDTGCPFKGSPEFGKLTCFIWPDKITIQQENID
jgi:serine/threonine protein phosphatase 1